MESSPSFPGAASLSPVHPVRPVAPYVGGKRNLSRRLVARIGTIPHAIYAEPFVGMGGVFLRRDSRPPLEVINDWSEDVATFFRILQRHYVAFMEMLRFQLTTRAGFERLQRTDPTTLTDLERAARFLYIQRLAFGGRVTGRTFGVSFTSGSRFDITKLAPMLEAVHERLAGVLIERLPWQAFVDRYDRPETLFFLDPPYLGSEEDYGDGMFSRDDFRHLADRLAKLRGRFILTINATPETRSLFAHFDVEETDVTYSLAGMHKARSFTELIVSNAPP